MRVKSRAVKITGPGMSQLMHHQLVSTFYWIKIQSLSLWLLLSQGISSGRGSSNVCFVSVSCQDWLSFTTSSWTCRKFCLVICFDNVRFQNVAQGRWEIFESSSLLVQIFLLQHVQFLLTTLLRSSTLIIRFIVSLCCTRAGKHHYRIIYGS